MGMEPLLRALVENGPVAVSVAAGHGWNMYWEGIMSQNGCGQDFVVNHGVVLFGYGSENVGTDRSGADKNGIMKYWHMKNSWGEFWGENGFLRLQRLDSDEEHCGWDYKPEFGNGCGG